MAAESDERRRLHVVAGSIGVFVLLNESFGTGSLEGLLQVSWGRGLPWLFLGLGLAASALIVEAYRRRRGSGTRWFIEVYAGIGGVYVLGAVIEEFLSPLTFPILEPLREMGVWGVVLFAAFVLGGGVLMFRRLWNGYRDLGPPGEQG